MEYFLESLVNYTALAVEIVAVLIIAYAALRGIILFIKSGLNFRDEGIEIELARAMSLALSFLLAGEILYTILVTNITNLVVIMGIAGLRVALHFVLHWEINEACREKKIQISNNDSVKN